MEVVKQWEDGDIEGEEVYEDVSLQKKRFRQESNTIKPYEDGLPVHPVQSFNDAEDSGSSFESSGSESLNLIISDTVSVDKTQKIKIENGAEMKQQFDEKALPLSSEQASFSNGRIEKEVGELDLERVYDKPGSHNFYCPNCNSCITKVIIRDPESETRLASESRPVPADTFRCTSCFSFLIPIGNWFFPKLVSPTEEDPAEQDGSDPVSSQPGGVHVVVITKPRKPDFKPELPSLEPALVDGGSMQKSRLDSKKETTISITEDFRVGTMVQSQESMEIQYDHQEFQSESKTKDPSSDQKVGINILVSKNPSEIEILTPSLAPLEAVIIDRGKKSEPRRPVSITAISGITETRALEPSRESKRWQVVKSIVYGGLAESITSLGIVTSAASADTKTANIVVLALANLIGGLFVIGHNLRDLKNDQFRRSKDDTQEQVDRYEEALGERENIILHFSVVVLSFLVAGLIPPLVYGFSFRESDNRDFKLGAVAGASLLCIALLGLGKAHIQKPAKWQGYIRVIAYYLGIGIGVSGLSYLAGDLIGKLLDKFGWFKSSSEATLLLLAQMGFSEPAFVSY